MCRIPPKSSRPSQFVLVRFLPVPPDHVTIEIDGKSLVVPKGSMIIQAADKAGIPIPRFCYAAHPVSHDPAQPLDTGIDRALWLTPAELQAAGERQ
ncbi:2Fe-2S iron-sulfur cluster-binding protein, partial [Stenotrophomonas sp. 3diitr2024]|uniref:2Fe-2S iron-sulfur cluster-binding protein n=1 Tax=Stenotrophomonas sp. 3diitr2024 TaxID=3345115 RepID=UPI0035C9C501